MPIGSAERGAAVARTLGGANVLLTGEEAAEASNVDDAILGRAWEPWQQRARAER